MRHGTCKHVMLSAFALESKELIEGALRVSCSYCGVFWSMCDVDWGLRGLRPLPSRVDGCAARCP